MRARVAWRALPAVAVLGLLTAGCSLGGDGAASTAAHNGSPVALVSYETPADNGYRILLRYPRSWRRYGWGVVSSFTNSMAYLGTGREHAPCRTTHPNGSIETTCGWPVKGLAPGGILVIWSGTGFPAPAGRRPLAGVPGDLLRAPAGWLEKISIRRPAICPGLNATRSITAYFARPSWSGESLHMLACLREPGDGSHTDQVLAMLQRVRFIPARA